MNGFFLGEGLVINRNGITLEFLRRSQTTLYFEDAEGGDITFLEEAEFFQELHNGSTVVAKAFSSDKELHLPALPIQKQPELSTTLVKYQDEAVLRQAYVQGVKKRGITRGQIELIAEAIDEIASERGDSVPPSPITVATWMRRYELNGNSISALIPAHAMRKTRRRTTAEHKQLIDDVIDEFYLTRERISVATLYLRYVAAIQQENADRKRSKLPALKPLSPRTIYRRVAQLSKYEVAAARFGRQEARRRFRMVIGHMPASRPLEFLEIDHTPLDLFVIDDRSLLPLGRPWLTVIKDRYSKILVGFYCSFAGPSIQSIFGALKHSFYPHHRIREICPELENEWPQAGRAETYVSDHGPEFMSSVYQVAIAQLGSAFEYAEVLTPWHKPSVERFIGVINSTLLDALPGKTFSHVLARQGYDSARQAVVRFGVFVQLLLKWAVDFHNCQPNRRTGARPIDLWREGLGDSPVFYPPAPEALKTILGITQTRQLGHEGIAYESLNFANYKLLSLFKDIGTKQKVVFKVDPSDLGSIRVLDPRTQQYFEVTCTRPEYASGLTLYQHQLLKRIAREKGQDKLGVDALARVAQDLRAMVGEKLSQHNRQTRKRLARLADINSNAVIAGHEKYLGSPLGNATAPVVSETPDPSTPELEVAGPEPSPFTDIPTFGWRSDTTPEY